MLGRGIAAATTAVLLAVWPASAAAAGELTGERAAADCNPQRGGTQVGESWAQQRLNFTGVWPLTRGAGVTVALVDSGVDTRHPQLKSVQSMSLICETISAPTMTSAAAATSRGTTWVSGVKNMARMKSSPVTTEAKPVRAPSPMPEADSTKTVFDDELVAPPATAPMPSTTSADFRRGNVPSGAATSAAFARPDLGLQA